MIKFLEQKKAYTLIELSMVLIIVSLFVSITAMGSHLIRASEIRSVLTDINQYKVAISGFTLQYGELPGDIKDAQDFWPSTCVDDEINLCNGNSDDIILPSKMEGLRAWQHLTLANILPNTYTGILDKSIQTSANEFRLENIFVSSAYAKQEKITICHNDHNITVAKPAVINAHLKHGDTIGSCEGTGGEESSGTEIGADYNGKYTIGVNIPASRIHKAGYKIDWNGGLMITFAAERDDLLDGAVLSSFEAWEIDMKLDDGISGKGLVMADNGYDKEGCIEDNGYVHNTNEINCQMHFWIDGEEL